MNKQIIATFVATFALGGAVGSGTVYELSHTVQVSCPAGPQADDAARAKFFAPKPFPMNGKTYP